MSSDISNIGIPLGGHGLPFNLMNGFGVPTKMIHPHFLKRSFLLFNGLELAYLESREPNGRYHPGVVNEIYGYINKEMDGLLSAYDKDFSDSQFITISACDCSCTTLSWLTQYLAERVEKPKLIGVGGPLVRKETLPYLNDINADFLNMGDLSSFVNYAKNTGIKEIPGIYKKRKHGFEGFGTGSPQVINKDILVKSNIVLSSPETEIEETKDSIIVNKSNENYIFAKIFGIESKCPNNCGYCASKSNITSSTEAYINAIKSVHTDEKKAVLSFYDNNPLMAPGKYKEILDSVCEAFDSVFITSFYVDPTALLNKDAKKFMDSLLKNDKIEKFTMFIGRECCDEKTAFYLGRNYFGKRRTQKMLDKENQSIKTLINNEKIAAHIPYILAPVETQETIGNRLTEIDELLKINDAVSVTVQTLKANAGTEAYKKYEPYLISPFPGYTVSNIEVPFFRSFERSYFEVGLDKNLNNNENTIKLLEDLRDQNFGRF